MHRLKPFLTWGRPAFRIHGEALGAHMGKQVCSPRTQAGTRPGWRSPKGHPSMGEDMGLTLRLKPEAAQPPLEGHGHQAPLSGPGGFLSRHHGGPGHPPITLRWVRLPLDLSGIGTTANWLVTCVARSG